MVITSVLSPDYYGNAGFPQPPKPLVEHVPVIQQRSSGPSHHPHPHHGVTHAHLHHPAHQYPEVNDPLNLLDRPHRSNGVGMGMTSTAGTSATCHSPPHSGEQVHTQVSQVSQVSVSLEDKRVCVSFGDRLIAFTIILESDYDPRETIVLPLIVLASSFSDSYFLFCSSPAWISRRGSFVYGCCTNDGSWPRFNLRLRGSTTFALN